MSLLTGNVVTTHIDQLNLNNLNATLGYTNDTDALLKAEKVQVMTSLTLLVGIVQMVMGVTGLGFMSSFFSDAFVSSYTCGSAMHVLVSQIKSLLGIKKTTRFQGVGSVPKTFLNLCTNLVNANWKTSVFSLCCCVFLLIMKEIVNPRVKRRIKMDIPAEIILVRKIFLYGKKIVVI